MKIKSALFLLFVPFCVTAINAQEMTLDRLKIGMAGEAKPIKESGNVAEYEFDSVRIYLITDVASNRMRLMAGVIEESKLKTADLKKLMEANYDRALDAKYALNDGILWSVFVHPLKELTPEELTSAIYQVRNLVYTYGTTYTSTNFVFGGDGNDRDK